jgi:hypothetical protein
LFALETKERKKVLPIWHSVTHEQVLAFNPVPADRFAIPSTKSLAEIVSVNGSNGSAFMILHSTIASGSPWYLL